jgi:hypothetical protein
MKRLVIALAAAAALMQPAWAVPPRFHYQARLTDSGGAPINGAATLFVGIYQGGSAGTANSGTKMYEETAAVTASQGVVDHAVGGGTPTFGSALTPDMLRFSGDMFLQVAVNSAPNVVLPRQRLESVPYALVSADGETRIALSGPLPISITAPGSYVLTGNMTTNNTTGITIDSDDVTLDLNGYTVSTSQVATDYAGVAVTYGRGNIVVRNGTFRGWAYGVNAQNTLNSRFEKLQAMGVLWFGVMAGKHCIVRDCVARDCGYAGIFGQEGCTVSDCAVSNASQTNYDYGGIYLGDSCVLTNSTVMFTNGSGITTGNACTLSNCSATTCSTNYSSMWQAGISTGAACTLRDCTAYGCALYGISAADGNTLVNCAAQYCLAGGIWAGTGCTLKGCSGLRNYSGISAGQNSVLELCTASYNQLQGLFVHTDSRVIGCVANDNVGDGILAFSRCTVVGNTATRNGSNGYGSGIRTGNLCKVDSNTANDNGGYGVECVGYQSVIVRNTWGGNIAGDLWLGAGTHLVGPTVNSGNIATSSNPHGNYSP